MFEKPLFLKELKRMTYVLEVQERSSKGTTKNFKSRLKLDPCKWEKRNRGNIRHVEWGVESSPYGSTGGQRRSQSGEADVSGRNSQSSEDLRDPDFIL